MSNESFTFSDVDGFLFGLFDPAATPESIQTGNGNKLRAFPTAMFRSIIACMSG